MGEEDELEDEGDCSCKCVFKGILLVGIFVLICCSPLIKSKLDVKKCRRLNYTELMEKDPFDLRN